MYFSTKINYLKNETVCSLFERQVEFAPSSTAVVFENETLSYSKLNQRVNEIALKLIELGINAGNIVAIHIERSIDLPAIVLAILKIGATYLPLDVESPLIRLKNMLLDAAPRLLVTDESHIEKFKTYTGDIISKEKIIKKSVGKPSCYLNSTPSSKDRAYIIYTSGSTGEPKGVESMHMGLTNRIVWMQEHYEITPKDVILHKTPLSFDVSLWEIFLPLIAGATLVIAPSFAHKEPTKIIQLINKYLVTTIHFVPAMLGVFLEFLPPTACSSLKNVFSSGEALNDSLADIFFKKLKAKLHNLYGPTEASIDVTYHECKQHEKVNIGKPLPNIAIYVLNDSLIPCKKGEVGEIYISGIGLASGYLNKPSLTAERFLVNPFLRQYGAKSTYYAHMYKTGDLGTMLPNGEIEYVGRVDHQVKINGHRIELAEIEAVLKDVPLIKEAIVLKKSNDVEVYLSAFLIPSNDYVREQLEKSLKENLRDHLPVYMHPKEYTFLDRFPLTQNGKIDREHLSGLPVKTILETHKPQIKPYNEISIGSKVCEIFSSFLGNKAITINDNYFDLGGSSIIAMKISLKLRKEFGVPISLKAIFTSNSIGEVCQILETRSTSNNSHGQ